MAKQTFRTWLLKQDQRDDWIGDLARDAKQAADLPYSNKYTWWSKYLSKRGACQEAKTALMMAWLEYNRV